MSISFYTSGSSQFNNWLRKEHERDASVFIDQNYVDEDGAFYPVHDLLTELKGIQPKLVKTFRGCAAGLIQQFSKNGVYRDPGFVSTSTSWGQARLFFRDAMLTVVGVGYPIDGQSSFALEQEVLFLPNAKFRLASCANGMLLVQEGVDIPSNWDIDSKKSYMVDTALNPMAMTLTPDDLTFGVEIEFLDEDKHGDKIRAGDVAEALEDVVDILIHYDDPESYWTATTDGSCGLEVKSRILRGTEGLDELRRVIETLARMGYRVDDDCGFHVHIGVGGMHPDKIKSIVKRYDDGAIDGIMRPSRRGDSNTYCRSINSSFSSPRYVESQRTITGIAKQQGGRYSKVNTIAFIDHKTIEFRHHHGTLDASRIENWVKFLLQFVAETDTWNLTDIGDLLSQFDWDEDDTYYLSEEEQIRPLAWVVDEWRQDFESYLESRRSRNSKFIIWHSFLAIGTVRVRLRERFFRRWIPGASIHVHFNEDWKQKLEDFLNQYK